MDTFVKVGINLFTIFFIDQTEAGHLKKRWLINIEDKVIEMFYLCLFVCIIDGGIEACSSPTNNRLADISSGSPTLTLPFLGTTYLKYTL